MISKEERAELRKLIEQAAVWPLPWEAHGDGYSDNLVFSANDAQEDYLAEFTGRHGCDLAVAAVNAAPKLLHALDELEVAASEREELWRLREKEHALAARMVGRQADQLKEAKARIAELEAAAAYRSCEICADGNNCDGYMCPICTKRVGSQWQPMATALRNGTEILLSKGWNVFGQHLGFEVTDDWDDEYAAPDWRWLPIPALPEGCV